MKNTLERAGVRMHGQANTRNAGHVPPLSTDVQNMKAHELRALNAKLDDAFTTGAIADANVRAYHDFQTNVRQQLDALELQASKVQHAAPSQDKPSAPSYLRSVGDNARGLAKNFSISKAIVAASEGRQLDGAEAEVTQEGRRQFAGTRGQVVIPDFVLQEVRATYGNDSGSGSIDAAVTGRQTLAGAWSTALHVQPLAQQLGAVVLDASGSSTFLVPYLGRTAAGSAAEGAGVTSTATFSELSLTPTRYARVATYSALALRTTGAGLDEILVRDFQEAHTTAHDAAAFAAIRSSATYTLATEDGTNGLAATTLSKVFDLAKDATQATGANDSPVIVASPEGYNVMNSTAASGLYQTLSTAYMNGTGKMVRQATNLADGDFDAVDIISGADAGTIAGAGLIIAGDFSSCVLAKWGGIDVVLDPYSGNESGLITLAANSYCAAGITRDAFRALAVAGSAISAT